MKKRTVKVKNSEIIQRIHKEEQVSWMFVGEDNYTFVKIQICYGEYLVAGSEALEERDGGRCL